MKVYESVDQLVGHTPLLELKRVEEAHEVSARILGKLEYFNPAGSIKDRIAKAMIDDAEAAGILKPGATIIEICGSRPRETRESDWLLLRQLVVTSSF